MRYFLSIIIPLLFYFGCINLLISQSTWQKTVDQGRYDGPSNLLQGDSGTFYFIHRFENGTGGPVTQVLTKLSLNGNEIWNQSFSNVENHVFEGPAITLENYDLLVCFYYDNPSEKQYVIRRISPQGDILWTTNLPGILSLDIDYGFELYKAICLAPDDIRLYFRMANWLPSDPTVAKNGYLILDSIGHETHREYFDTGGEYQWPYNIVPIKDNYFVKVYRPTIGSLYLIIRYDLLDENHNLVWSYEVGPEDGGGGAGPLCSDTSGNIYFTWQHDTTGNGGPFHQLPSIISLNHEGEFRWLTSFGEDRGVLVFFDIIRTSDGRIIACGEEGNTSLSGGNYRTGWIVCVDTLGNKLWERRYVLEETRDSGNYFNHVIESEDGGLVLLGELYPKEGGSNVWLMKTDRDGCLNPSCELYNFISLPTATSELNEQNDNFYLFVRGDLLYLILKEVPHASNLHYKLLTSTGQVVGNDQINSNEMKLDISRLSSGIYFIIIYNNVGKSIKTLRFFKAE